jgi:MoaA/NifB/PqqE/SkfB family radical SAM enzyme
LQEKGPLYILPWRCTFACNYNCVHCTSAGKPAAQDEVNTEEAKRIVDQAYEFGASFFGIKGGEALLRKDTSEPKKAALQMISIILGVVPMLLLSANRVS